MVPCNCEEIQCMILKLTYEPVPGDFDAQLMSQRHFYTAGLAVYITLSLMKRLLWLLLLLPALTWGADEFPEATNGRWLPDADQVRINKIYGAGENPSKADADAIREVAIEGIKGWSKQWPSNSCSSFRAGDPRLTTQGQSVLWVWCTVRKHEGRDSQGLWHIEDETTAYFAVIARAGSTWEFKRGYESRAKLLLFT